MSTQIGDLWPELERATGRTPASILKEQASALARRTSGLVEAEVKTRNLGNSAGISHAFVLVAPALDDYRFELFVISHPITLYPIQILRDATRSESPKSSEDWIYKDTTSDELDEIVAIQPLRTPLLGSEEEFVQWLKRVFNSDRTKQLVNALLLQSTS